MLQKLLQWMATAILALTVAAEDSPATRLVIEWWTPRLFPHQESPTFITCPYGNGAVYECQTRKDGVSRGASSSQRPADGYVLYGSDLDLDLKNLPWHRRDAVWALIHEESPLNNYALVQPQVINELFHVKATFQRNSSYPVTTQFLKSLEYLYSNENVVDLKTKNRLRAEEGLASVVYLQSNCRVPSDRERYVKKLMEYIKVDSYGACLRNKDWPPEVDPEVDSWHPRYDSESLYKLMAQYKFFLAFENSICDDYVTEKLWRSLHLGVVPIYRGSDLVMDFAPDSFSLIHVKGNSLLEREPSALADLLMRLDADDAEYRKYLNWKDYSLQKSNPFLFNLLREREWSVDDPEAMDYFRGFECYVCKHLNSRRTKDNPVTGCPGPRPAMGLNESSLSPQDDWFFWSFEWKRAVDFAANLLNKSNILHNEL